MAFVWILTIGTAAMAGSLWIVRAFERRRARLLKEAGVAVGLRAFAKGELLDLPPVEIMRKRGRTIGAVLEGNRQGEQITVFDLSYPAGKSSSQTTVLMLRLPEPRIPEFAAIRKNAWLYTPTVDLPKIQDPPSSLKPHWLLYAPNGQWPFDESVTEWLARNPDWSFEGRGSGLFLYRRAKRAPTNAFREWLDEAIMYAKELAKRIPAARSDDKIDDGDPTSTHSRVFSFTKSFRFRV
jgi:hypothetical protein